MFVALMLTHKFLFADCGKEYNFSALLFFRYSTAELNIQFPIHSLSHIHLSII